MYIENAKLGKWVDEGHTRALRPLSELGYLDIPFSDFAVEFDIGFEDGEVSLAAQARFDISSLIRLHVHRAGDDAKPMDMEVIAIPLPDNRFRIVGNCPPITKDGTYLVRLTHSGGTDEFGVLVIGGD